MGKRFQIGSGFLLLALALAACGRGGGQALPPSASKPAADLRVLDQREIKIEGRILSLSPNGEWLAVHKGQILCIYKTKSLTENSCAELKTGAIDQQSVAWSPDSTHVAFTEDFARYVHESDLWVLEVETGKLTNLTDDGLDRFRFTPESEADNPLIDLIPTWSSDNKTLLFPRSARTAGEWDGTALYRIPINGGEPEKLLIVDDEFPTVVWSGLRWSSDGKQILYTAYYRKPADPGNGIWTAERDGKNQQHILGMTDPEIGPPFLVDVSAKGEKTLIWYYMAATGFSTRPNISYFALLDLKTGRVAPLKQAKSEEIEFYSPLNAIFAPDGSKILYTYRDASGETRLAVRDVGGQTEHVLLTRKDHLGAGPAMGLGLDWAENDTIYAATSPFSGLLLRVGTE
jgi:predicted small lipoprotein YifL